MAKVCAFLFLVKRMTSPCIWQFVLTICLTKMFSKMKKVSFVILMVPLLLSSCCSIFTSSRQTVTFVGKEGTRIYDNGVKIATIGESGETSVRIRKKLSSKELIAKKEGYKPTPLVLESTFNPIACINLLNVLAWGIDLGTQKACKWENTYFEIDMEEKE